MTQTATHTEFNTREARFNMIEQQIRTWDVLDPVVLAVLDKVPRENFVAESQKGLAFADIELPIPGPFVSDRTLLRKSLNRLP